MVIQKYEKSKKGFFKNCLTLFVSGREKNAHFRAHYLFWPNFFTKTDRTTKHYKNRAFSGKCPKPKMTPFFWKRCFSIWSKNWVLLIVFCKAVFFLVFFGGFKGQVRWPKGPPHLALNPPYLFCLFCFVLFFLFVCFLLFIFFWYLFFGRV